MVLVPHMMVFMSPEGNGWGEGTSFWLLKGTFCMMIKYLVFGSFYAQCYGLMGIL